MRNLRASIFAASHPQVIAVTSPSQREGKTETALALAISINATGKSVLVIDGDFRNRDFDAYFDMDRASGLQQVISGDARFANCILELEETGLHILPAGSPRVDDNSSDLLFHPNLAAIITLAKSQYDCVIVDTPPLLQFSDALMWVKMANQYVLLVSRTRSSAKDVREATLALAQVTGVWGLACLSQVDNRQTH